MGAVLSDHLALVLMGDPMPYGARRPGSVDAHGGSLHRRPFPPGNACPTCHSYVEQLIETTAAARGCTGKYARSVVSRETPSEGWVKTVAPRDRR